MIRDRLPFHFLRTLLNLPLPTALEPRTGGVSWRVLAKRRWSLDRRRTFDSEDLDHLEKFLGQATVLPIREAFERRGGLSERYVALRHDTDDDIENAVRFARWEATHGFRSTYYVLHTDWYYPDLRSGRPSRFVLRALDEIASLGHEIGLHNNAIAVALRTGEDPAVILDRELSALRRHGFDIVGTVAHGDRVCHEANFVNFEMFTECPWPSCGAPDRVIVWEDARTTLCPRPMAGFGLTHEANFIGQAMYLSDSGGVWGQPWATSVKRFEQEDGFLQILTHPIYWAFRDETVLPNSQGTHDPG